MKVLVINCGSSSIKYQLFEMSNESVIAKGLAEKIGLPEGCIDLKITGKEGKIEVNLPLPNHSVALNKIMELMTENGVIMDKSEIKAIGHRLVHAGEYYNGSVPITDDVISKLEECSDLAPLHNPPNILGVKTCLELFPGTFMSGTFDTAFHQTMPDYAYIYPISYEYYEKYKVRRYGFHGSSHLFVSKRAAEMLGKKIEETKIITCHLGNGCSMAAVLGGKSVDTSMGLTPLEGIMMGTRSGDIDPALIFYLTDKHNGDMKAVNNMLNKNSGLKGVSGVSNDMRDVRSARDNGNKRAELALNIFKYRLKKYIASYAAAMGGVDAIVFTGGIGENVWEVREDSLTGLEFMGVKINSELNKTIFSKETDISAADSKVKVFIIPTNEELVIARDAMILFENQK
ncbi:MAG TPA: acetate kinase [bacterium]|nr:acetate kinase [bacterium]HPV21475.1 acetate kinase [bacterium]HPY15004.1 acetate kinase [bacterium]HQB09268.1 acetate kinase [bacterium]HQM84190.1 acetate kinase [bacterium]